MNRIRALRQEANVKQEELAKYLKVSRSSLSGYETGNFEAPVQIYFQLADYFGVTLDYLLGRSDTPQPFMPRQPVELPAAPSGVLTEKENDLLGSFRKLNDEGQTAALSMMQGLTASPAYKKDYLSGQIQEGIG